MKLFLCLFLALASAGPLEKLVQKVGTPSFSLLQRCQEGKPILLETGNLPGNNRNAGDPCADDEQCAAGLKCQCQDTGGKECSNPCVVQGVVIPEDGQFHPVHCFASCQCSDGAVGCVDMCPLMAILCQPGTHQVQVPPAEGQCCGTLRCDPDEAPQTCDGAGRTCGGIAALQCSDLTFCVDDPNDGCDPHNGGVDCGGVCRCAAKLDQTDWTGVASSEWVPGTAMKLAQNKGGWNSGTWPIGLVTITPSRPTYVRFVRLRVDQLPSPATTTHVFSVTTGTPEFTEILTRRGVTAAQDWVRVEVNQVITSFQAKTTVSPSWVAWFDADFYG